MDLLYELITLSFSDPSSTSQLPQQYSITAMPDFINSAFLQRWHLASWQVREPSSNSNKHLSKFV
jgi:hypothetical protein